MRDGERGVVDDGDRQDARSRPVRFTPSSVRPQTGVISEPAYVVGTATTGSARSSAIALPSPMAEPPPTATQPSASTDAATSPARRATSTGTCIRASGSTPTTRSPRRSATRRPSSWCDGPQITSTRVEPERVDLLGEPLQRADAEAHPLGSARWTKSRVIGSSRSRPTSKVEDAVDHLADQALLDPEDGVGVEVGAVRHEHVRGHRPVARRAGR